MLILALFFQLHYLCTAVRASAIPSKANSFTLPGHELSVATPPSEHTTDLEVFVPRTSTTEIAEIGKHHALAVFDKRDKTVWVAGLEAAGKIGEAACKAGFWSCAVFCISAVVIAYFAYQYFTNDSPSTKGGTFTHTRRAALSDTQYNWHEKYSPTENCGPSCMLNDIPEGEWTHVANSTVNGVQHHIHHFRNGTTKGMRAHQLGDPTATDSTSKRDPYDQDENSGVVGDFYWSSDSSNLAAYDSFDSSTSGDNEFASEISNDMEGGNWIEACADFGDSDGLLEGGVIALGWNGNPFSYSSQSALDDHLADCKASGQT